MALDRVPEVPRPLGRGLAHGIARRPNVLSLHTCGKALGASGALICGQRVLIETLINKARGFIFATVFSVELLAFLFFHQAHGDFLLIQPLLFKNQVQALLNLIL